VSGTVLPQTCRGRLDLLTEIDSSTLCIVALFIAKIAAIVLICFCWPVLCLNRIRIATALFAFRWEINLI